MIWPHRTSRKCRRCTPFLSSAPYLLVEAARVRQAAKRQPPPPSGAMKSCRLIESPQLAIGTRLYGSEHNTSGRGGTPRAGPTSGAEKFRPSVKKDLFNSRTHSGHRVMSGYGA